MSFEKFQILLQKGFFRLLMLAALVLFIGVFVYAVHLENNNKGPDGLRIPPDIAAGKPSIRGDGGQTDNPLAVQHMSSVEVGVALSDMAVEALSFNRNNYGSTVSGAQKFFTPDGYAQYKQFLNNSAFEQALENGNLQAGAYVEGAPLELGRGVYGGAFKWVLEVPVTISFVPRGTNTYENAQVTPENRRFTLRAQLARVNDPQDPDAVKIELWQVLPPRS